MLKTLETIYSLYKTIAILYAFPTKTKPIIFKSFCLPSKMSDTTKTHTNLKLSVKRRSRVREAVVTLSLIELILAIIFAGFSNGELQVGFYKGKCGPQDVEVIVAGVITSWFFRDPSILASLVRLQFHDCFVNVRLIFICPIYLICVVLY